MYESLDDFKNDASSCGPAFYTDGSLDTDEKMQRAYNVYLNAKKSTALLMAIVGRLNLKIIAPLNAEQTNAQAAENEKAQRENRKPRELFAQFAPSDELYPSIDAEMRNNFLTVNDSGETFGSIFDTQKWTLLSNDAWLLGNLHVKNEFHFASPITWSNLWDPCEWDKVTFPNGKSSVTAREILGILAAGYRILKTQLEPIADCQDPKKAVAFTLPMYKKAVEDYQTEAALNQFYTQNLSHL